MNSPEMVDLQDDSAGTFRLTDGVAIADERELRQLARPEEWCARESMTNALTRLSQLGLTQQDRLSAIPLERLRIASEQLSPPEVPLDAYGIIFAPLQSIWHCWAEGTPFLSKISISKHLSDPE